MTVAELIVYNSTIAPGEGTVIEHLQNIAITREVFKGVSIDIIDNIDITITSGIITANVADDKLIVNVEDGTNIDTIDSKIGVSL